MKTALCSVALLLLALSLASEAVQVQENDLIFSLEAVQKLQALTSMTETQNPRLRSSAGSVCADPALPMEFYALCQQRGATMSLSRLASIPLDVCEICAYAACTGC